MTSEVENVHRLLHLASTNVFPLLSPKAREMMLKRTVKAYAKRKGEYPSYFKTREASF